MKSVLRLKKEKYIRSKYNKAIELWAGSNVVPIKKSSKPDVESASSISLVSSRQLKLVR